MKNPKPNSAELNELLNPFYIQEYAAAVESAACVLKTANVFFERAEYNCAYDCVIATVARLYKRNFEYVQRDICAILNAE